MGQIDNNSHLRTVTPRREAARGRTGNARRRRAHRRTGARAPRVNLGKDDDNGAGCRPLPRHRGAHACVTVSCVYDGGPPAAKAPSSFAYFLAPAPLRSLMSAGATSPTLKSYGSDTYPLSQAS